jgi:hypothetical protein
VRLVAESVLVQSVLSTIVCTCFGPNDRILVKEQGESPIPLPHPLSCVINIFPLAKLKVFGSKPVKPLQVGTELEAKPAPKLEKFTCTHELVLGSYLFKSKGK